MSYDTTEDQIRNQALENYLIRYCIKKIAPYFSILIEGPWGSGKTWFINRIRGILELVHKKRCIYVSLYGVSKIPDITDQFFQQLHPHLSNKNVQRSWTIIKSMVKVSLKLDINGDNDADMLNLSIPDLGEIAGPDGAILIFDDFERCRMPAADILGYINQFVEHDGYRVIILANEDKIFSQDGKFEEIKEKVIGRTFRIQPQANSALDSFLDELVSDDSINILKNRKKLILEINRRCNYENLRLVRQAVLDFSDIWSCLPVEEQRLRKNAEFLDRLVSDIFSISIEYRAGKIKTEHIQKLKNGGFAFGRLKFGSSDGAPQQSEEEKRMIIHNLTESWNLALPPDTYFLFFSRGHLSISEAAEGIAVSKYFVTETKPAWQRLWHRRELDDISFKSLSEEVLKKFTAFEYHERGELFHVVGMLLDLASKNLISKDIPYINNLAKNIVTELAKKGLIDFGGKKFSPMRFFDRDSAYSLGFMGLEMQEFKEFTFYYEEAVANKRLNEFKNWALEWIGELNVDVNLWASRIATNGNDDAFYAEQPVFKYADPDMTVQLILNRPANEIIAIKNAIEARYQHLGFHTQWHIEELKFWEDFLAKIKFEIPLRNQQALSTFYLRESLTPLINKVVLDITNAKEKFSS